MKYKLHWRQEGTGYEDDYRLRDTETYESLVTALKRYIWVTTEAPYIPGEEDQYIVLAKGFDTLLDERENYLKESAND